MENFLIGEYIKQRRLDLGLTQGEVCHGICDAITLSRLENGKQTPSRSRINAILQRLGLPDSRYIALMNKDELAIEALKKEIVGCNVLERVDQGFEKLARLEQLAEPDDHLTQQFVLRSRVLLGRLDGRYTHEQALQMLMQAIWLTSPFLELDETGRGLYTVDEIKILSHIAITYSEMGNNQKAADIYYQLLKYVRKHFQEVLISGGMLPTILYNYARVLDLMQHYSEGAEYARQSMEACIKYGHFYAFPRALEIRAECLHFLGRDHESTELYYQAYYLAKALGHTASIEITRREAKEYLNLEFPY